MEMFNIVRVNIVGKFCGKIGDSFNPKNFMVASLCYYVLTVIFVALE